MSSKFRAPIRAAIQQSSSLAYGLSAEIYVIGDGKVGKVFKTPDSDQDAKLEEGVLNGLRGFDRRIRTPACYARVEVGTRTELERLGLERTIGPADYPMSALVLEYVRGKTFEQMTPKEKLPYLGSTVSLLNALLQHRTRLFRLITDNELIGIEGTDQVCLLDWHQVSAEPLPGLAESVYTQFCKDHFGRYLEDV